MESSRQFYWKTIVTILAFLTIWIAYLFMPIVHDPEGVTFVLKPGTSKRALVADLSSQGVIRLPILFSLFIYPQFHVQLKTGEYQFRQGSSVYSIWRQVTSGRGLMYRPFTIVPGWSFRQLRGELMHTVGFKHMTAKLDDRQVMDYMGASNTAPEGQFFPETYYYTRGIADLVILKRAYDLMQKQLAEAWQHRSANLPYKSSYEALIAASMIEKEAFLNNERSIIARVLINRLNKDMLLQFDPTVIYGLGERYKGKIMRVDLAEDTPFNTYLHRGLPPTPISMPSLKSIDAALHPAQNDYLYFVARGDGSHQFSSTLLEHNVAVTNANANTTLKKQTPAFNERFIQNYLHPRDTLKNNLRNSTLQK